MEEKPKKRFPFIKMLGGAAILTSLLYAGDKCDVAENTARTWEAIKKNASYAAGRAEKAVYGATSTDPEEFLEELEEKARVGEREFRAVKGLRETLEEYKQDIASGEFEDSLPGLEAVFRDSVRLIEQYRSPEAKAEEIEAANPAQKFKDELNALVQSLPKEKLDGYLSGFAKEVFDSASPAQKKEMALEYAFKAMGYKWDKNNGDFQANSQGKVILEEEEMLRLRQASGSRLEPKTAVTLDLNEIVRLPDEQRKFVYQETAKTLAVGEQFSLLKQSYPNLDACLKSYTTQSVPVTGQATDKADNYQAPPNTLEKSLPEKLQDNVKNLMEAVFPKKT